MATKAATPTERAPDAVACTRRADRSHLMVTRNLLWESAHGTGGPRMAQYVALMVLRHLRDLPRLESQHRRAEWRRFAPREEGTVGLLGYGTIGAPVADALQQLGFPVIAWTRTPHIGSAIEICMG